MPGWRMAGPGRRWHLTARPGPGTRNRPDTVARARGVVVADGLDSPLSARTGTVPVVAVAAVTGAVLGPMEKRYLSVVAVMRRSLL
jgi:hypothetical protein